MNEDLNHATDAVRRAEDLENEAVLVLQTGGPLDAALKKIQIGLNWLGEVENATDDVVCARERMTDWYYVTSSKKHEEESEIAFEDGHRLECVQNMDQALRLLADVNDKDQHNVVGESLRLKKRMASMLYGHQEYDSSMTAFNELLSSETALYPDNHQCAAETIISMALCSEAMNQPFQAESLYMNALDMTKKVYGEDDSRVADVYERLGILKMNQGQLEESMTFLTKAYNAYAADLGHDDPSTAMVENMIAMVLYEQKHYDRVPECYERALKVLWHHQHLDDVQSVVSSAVGVMTKYTFVFTMPTD